MDDTGSRPAVSLWLRESNGSWYGVAEYELELVATAVGATRDKAESVLADCLPEGARAAPGEGSVGSDFADEVARTLAAIEAGDESGTSLPLSARWLSETASSVYRLTASIPLGYACSYGRIAAATGSVAREVGRLMATNPLYPLVPCHRVVGSDYSLVGYRGSKEGTDLDDKLAHLRAEARGYSEEIFVGEAACLLVFPVEFVIARAERRSAARSGQLSLF